MAVALIVLAAGQGSRMNSELPKVLHRLAGAPLLAHALRAGESLAPDRTVVITGHGAEAIEAAVAALDADATCTRQTEQLGTGHAVAQAHAALAGFDGDAVVLYGDTPFISPRTLEAMQDKRATGADLVVLGFGKKK